MKKLFAILFLFAFSHSGYAGQPVIETVDSQGIIVLKTYGAGTAYSLTGTSALVDLGTTDPTLVLTKPGSYLVFARVTAKYTGATFAANQTLTVKIRRTNNTAADLTNATTTQTLGVVTTVTDGIGSISLPPVVYRTFNTNDSISLYGILSATPSAGSVDITEAEIVAVRV